MKGCRSSRRQIAGLSFHVDIFLYDLGSPENETYDLFLVFSHSCSAHHLPSPRQLQYLPSNKWSYCQKTSTIKNFIIKKTSVKWNFRWKKLPVNKTSIHTSLPLGQTRFLGQLKTDLGVCDCFRRTLLRTFEYFPVLCYVKLVFSSRDYSQSQLSASTLNYLSTVWSRVEAESWDWE